MHNPLENKVSPEASLFSNYSNQLDDEIISCLRLIRSENVGPKTFYQLVKIFGSASNALENIQDFAKRGGKTRPIKVFSQKDALAEIEKLAKINAYLISYKDPNYPKLLKTIHDAPPVITCRGRKDLLTGMRLKIAIVGARNSSFNGKMFTKQLATDLIRHNAIIVSGLARGIDTAAQSVSSENTIAVIAGGIDHIYPPENIKLFKDIEENGLIIAELPIGSSPLSQHFPQRNRIISGLSHAVVVVEAANRSGSLITANFALEHGREVFAVPGFPMDPRYAGSNKLIKEGANLLETVDDIINNITLFDKIENDYSVLNERKNDPEYRDSQLVHRLSITDSDRKKFLDLLSGTDISLDILPKEINLPVQHVNIICLELELAGKIVRRPGNRISRIY